MLICAHGDSCTNSLLQVSVGAGQQKMNRVCSEDSVPFFVELGSTLSSPDLAVTVFKLCSAGTFLISILPCKCQLCTGFPALPSNNPKMLHSTDLWWYLTGKHASRIQVYIHDCETSLQLNGSHFPTDMFF